jgi:hypothetical protein
VSAAVLVTFPRPMGSVREESVLRLRADASRPDERSEARELRIEADAEKAICVYAKAREREADEARDFETAQEWAAIGPRCLAPLLENVPSSPFSKTWRDLLARTVLEARDPVTISGRTGGEDVLEVHAPKKKVPAAVRKIADEETFGAGEAVLALEELADVIRDLPLISDPAADLEAHLNAHAEAEVKKSGRKVLQARADLARRFGLTFGNVTRAAQRKRTERHFSAESVAPKVLDGDSTLAAVSAPKGDADESAHDERGRGRPKAQAADPSQLPEQGRIPRVRAAESKQDRVRRGGPPRVDRITKTEEHGRPRPRPRGVKRKRE